jgi:juvenile hormone-III synthase
MHNGKLYKQSNFAQRQTAFEVLDEFSHYFNWSINGKLLDIGTGSGDVLVEIVVPRLPKHVKVYGSDVSKEMVKFAKENFGDEVVSFHQTDISEDYEILAKKLPQPFDNITSLFCFHWIQNQR